MRFSSKVPRGRDGPPGPTARAFGGGSSQHCSQLQDRLPGPPTHDLKAGLHHLSHREAYGATWSSLGSSLAKSTFGRPARGALRSGRGTVFTRLWSCEKRVHLHLLKKLKCPCGVESPGEQLYRGCIEYRSNYTPAIARDRDRSQVAPPANARAVPYLLSSPPRDA